MEKTRQSIQDAIEANLRAQHVVQKQLERLDQDRKRNRRQAAQLMLQIPISSMVQDPVTAPSRPWTQRFFVDAQGTVPEPNEDSKLRTRLAEGKSFLHQTPLWTKKEVSTLYEIVDKALEGADNTKKSLESLDFERVAEELNKTCKSSRSAQECRVKYQPNRSPITKHESLALLKQFHGGKELSLPDRTKWQSFQAFHSANSDKKRSPWTLEEDQTLLRIIAAAGPQQVIDQHFSAQLSGLLQKHPKSILQRTMNSLLNPNYLNDQWSDEDERKLCLAMKVYRDVSSPFVAVSSLFPYRSSRSINDKWSRTLNPIYHHDKHFTPEEDERLRKLNGNLDWKVMEKDFPGRLSQTLAKRWKELASQEQVVEQYRTNLKRKLVKDEMDQDDLVLRIKASPNVDS